MIIFLIKILPVNGCKFHKNQLAIFRQWKYFKQKIYDRGAIDEIDVEIRSRNCIVNMHSLIHNQLSARRFSNPIKYSRYSSVYTTNGPGHFENVQQVCFSFGEYLCSEITCSKSSFICCSHCDTILCFYHIFVDDYRHHKLFFVRKDLV